LFYTYFVGEWSLYREERFLLHDNRNLHERIILFSTDYGLSLLAEAQIWFVDGNFGLAPNFFTQLYIVRVQ